jgi:uncharacterized protein (TIGR03435 family)
LALLHQFEAARATAGQSAAPASEAFEVVSVKLLPAGPAGILGPLACRGRLQVDPGRFIAANVTLYRFVALGYAKNCPAFPSTEAELITGGPDWIKSDGFDVQGVIPQGSPNYTQRHLIDGHAPKFS